MLIPLIEMVNYGALHRYTIRMMFGNPAIDLSTFITKFSDYCTRNELDADRYSVYLSEQGFDKLCYEINEEFLNFNCCLRIKRHTMKVEGNKVYWVLVNTTDGALSTFATKLKPWETLLFKKMVEVSVEKDTSEPSFIATAKIMKFANEIKPTINHNELIAYLTNLVAENWLFEHSTVKGRFTLGVRALVELNSLISDLEE